MNNALKIVPLTPMAFRDAVLAGLIDPTAHLTHKQMAIALSEIFLRYRDLPTSIQSTLDGLLLCAAQATRRGHATKETLNANRDY